MWLVYNYTTHLNKYSDNNWVALYFKASIRRSKSLGYKIKMYGCDFMYHHLKDEVDEFINIQSLDFEFTDDLKLYIHSIEDLDCITIDGDIILNHKLQTPTDCDVIFDRRGYIHKKYPTKYKSYLDIFKKYNIESKIKHFDYNGIYGLNVGLLKFNNSEVKKILLDSYNEFKKYYKETISINENIEDPAIILCEYNFERIITKNNFKKCFYNDINHYTHYFSNMKETKEFKTKVNNILNPNSKSII